MTRFICPSCEEVVHAAARFAFCSGCGAPLTTENLLPVQLVRTGRDQLEEEVLAEPAAPKDPIVGPAARRCPGGDVVAHARHERYTSRVA